MNIIKKHCRVPEGAEVFPLIKLAEKSNFPILHIAMDDMRAEMLCDEIKFFAPEIAVLNFPAWDCSPYDRVSPKASVTSQRIKVLCELSKQKSDIKKIIISTINAASQRVMPVEVAAGSSFQFKVGEEYNRDSVARFLVENSYLNTGVANEPGEFALRGSLMDIIPSGKETGYRLDFISNELESIRAFDPLTQISSGKYEMLEILPAGEILLSEEYINNFRDKYREIFGAVSPDDRLYEAISEGRKYVGMEHWQPLFFQQMQSLFDYLPESHVTIGHLVPQAFEERINAAEESYKARANDVALSHRSENIYYPCPWELLYIPKDEWEKLLGEREVVEFSPYYQVIADSEQSEENNKDMSSLRTQGSSFGGGLDSRLRGNDTELVTSKYQPGQEFFVQGKALQKSTFELLKEAIQPQLIKGKGKLKTKALIACASEGSRARLEIMLKNFELEPVIIDDWHNQNNSLKPNNAVGLAILPIEQGFVAEGITLVSEADLLGEKIFRKSARRKKPENFLAEASNLHPGEFIVHKQHGIGRFEGLENMQVGGKSHDFIKLVYAGDDKLYLPVENIDLISRYGATEGVVLDKLGGLGWQKRTSALKKRIKVTAEELMKVAAEREINKAQIFHADSTAYEAFCARFPYAETDDQLNSIEDVLTDLESGKPMDRLICGDVGFGKTEVALRAAMVVASGKNNPQVAVICPTTLLCRQHYKHFKDRFADLGLEIRQLSRLSTAKELRETKQMMEDGAVDIIIGTHALLGKEVKFKNLALTIVDEEQRFGVSQKERLKNLRSNTHVLTLSATPIPRTLQLSLSGVRDLSLITTPPVDRFAVRTFVMPFDRMVVRDACLREHYRGGQSLYVCPRVADVEEMLPKLKELMPELKIITAHGQMPPEQLDEIMNEFYDGKYDLLLATTIVESGLDIPNANTLIVHRADMYGLAQLYQIRGRVGRGKLRAYAYLTLPPKRVPTQAAMKRLEVMQKLDTLGAGFTLATHDMDNRGFGNLLGDEQSGNIKEVGVELYQHMLQEAIDMARQAEYEKNKDAANAPVESETHSFSPKITLGIPVMIPEDYVEDLSLRMGLYRRIGALMTEEEVESIAAELADRFGAIPQEVENLLTTVKLKQMCFKANIEKLDAGKKGLLISFHQDYFPNIDALLNYVMRHPLEMKLRGDQKLAITDQHWDDDEERLRGVRLFLKNIADVAVEMKLVA